MSHLAYLPSVIYDFQNGTVVTIAHILKRIFVPDAAIADKALFFEYTVRDSDTAQIIADRLYGGTKNDWVIYLVNRIVDPYYQWPMTSSVLYQMAVEKYGIARLYDTHHFIDGDGDRCDQWTFGAQAISNLVFEEQENEARRKIKLLDPIYLDKFKSQAQTILSTTTESSYAPVAIVL